jgi:hypothetical protein
MMLRDDIQNEEEQQEFLPWWQRERFLEHGSIFAPIALGPTYSDFFHRGNLIWLGPANKSCASGRIVVEIGKSRSLDLYSGMSSSGIGTGTRFRSIGVS